MSQQQKLWKNCVLLKDIIPGTHNNWCVSDIGPGWTHTGQTTARCAKGTGKGICSSPHKAPPPATVPSNVAPTYQLYPNTDVLSGFYINSYAADTATCKTMCDNTPNCNAITTNNTACQLSQLEKLNNNNQIITQSGFDMYYKGSDPLQKV